MPRAASPNPTNPDVGGGSRRSPPDSAGTQVLVPPLEMKLTPVSLPLEIVLNIITQTLPTCTKGVLRPSDHTTRALLAWTLVCHETRRLANRYLLQYGLYIEHPNQYRALLSLRDNPGYSSLFTAMHLRPVYMENHGVPLLIPEVKDLLETARESLVQLMIGRTNPPYKYKTPRLFFPLDALSESFDALEEFVSLRGNSMELDQPLRLIRDVSAPKLKHLALVYHERDWSVEVFRSLISLPTLETLILNLPQPRACMDRSWQLCSIPARFRHGIAMFVRRLRRPLTVLMIAAEFEGMRPEEWRMPSWDEWDPEDIGMLSFMAYNVPCDDPHKRNRTVLDFVRVSAEKGTLWDLVDEAQAIPNV